MAPGSMSDSFAGDLTQARELAVRAFDAYLKGIGAVPPVKANLDAHFNAEYVLRMGKTLTLPEIACLLQSSRLREQALHLCRMSRHDEARALIGEARALLIGAELSDEAKAIGDSFQQAAEAFLYYRGGDSAAAKAALLTALRGCSVLGNTYGYEVEVRRVHLARNIIRVESASGDGTAALRLALCLVHYVDGVHELWPFPEVEIVGSSPLSMEERRILMDQVWGEISRLLLKGDSDAAQLWSEPELVKFTLSELSEFRELQTWLSAMRAFRHGDHIAFLQQASVFFAAGPIVENAWRELAETFLRTVKPALEQQGAENVTSKGSTC